MLNNVGNEGQGRIIMLRDEVYCSCEEGIGRPLHDSLKGVKGVLHRESCCLCYNSQCKEGWRLMLLNEGQGRKVHKLVT
jgi:hypothetical protein